MCLDVSDERTDGSCWLQSCSGHPGDITGATERTNAPYRPRTRPKFAKASVSVHASTAPQHLQLFGASRGNLGPFRCS